jgi:3-deoxy-D-manno-octulosonate 8-phosphate phosphatase (KDO 8-P phosphatase)
MMNGVPNSVMSAQASSAKIRAQKNATQPIGSARPSSLKRKLARVRLFLCDVDGVLTDASVWIGAENEIKRFNIQDGFGMLLLQREGIQVGWISNRPSPATTLRAEELEIDFLHQQAGKKVDAIEAILGQTGLSWPEVCYMGDDIVDLAALKRAGVAVAVPNGTEEVRAMADYVTKASGGCGAVREVVELILKAQRKWPRIIKEYSA